MVSVAPPPASFDIETDVVVVGAGACGLIAGLRALEGGAEVVVLERDARPTGSTAMSSGFIPAPDTRFQRAIGVVETPEEFAADIHQKAAGGADLFGRDFTAKPLLAPPFFAVRVTGALFHTQGGLMIDRTAAVRRATGGALPNLFAGGGAACGVSGPDLAGYLSDNGLLAAVASGALAGAGAAHPGQNARLTHP